MKFSSTRGTIYRGDERIFIPDNNENPRDVIERETHEPEIRQNKTDSENYCVIL